MTQLNRQENVFVLDISDSPEGDHRFTYERMQTIDAALTRVESTPGDLALVITAQGKFFSNGLVPELFVEPEYSAAFQSLVARLLVSEVPHGLRDQRPLLRRRAPAGPRVRRALRPR